MVPQKEMLVNTQQHQRQQQQQQNEEASTTTTTTTTTSSSEPLAMWCAPLGSSAPPPPPLPTPTSSSAAADPDGPTVPHHPRCDCGCIPPVLSMFEMAELRKQARLKKQRENAS